MKELSVFIDESGDFGEVKEHQGLSQMQKKLNRQEAAQSSLTNMFILIFSFGRRTADCRDKRKGIHSI